MYIFFTNSFLYFYESKWMNEPKKNGLIKAKKLCNIFRFINDLNTINDGGEFEGSYSNIYRGELQLVKENTNKHKANFLDLDMKIKDGKFHFSLFDKGDSLPFSAVRVPDKSSNVPSSTVYSAIDAELLRIARASNNPESFLAAIKPLIACVIPLIIVSFFNKHQGDFDNVCQSKQGLLHLVSQIMSTFSFYSFRPTNNTGCYRYADKILMSVFL